MTRMDEKSEVIEMTADIVSAYVGNNTVAAGDLPGLRFRTRDA